LPGYRDLLRKKVTMGRSTAMLRHSSIGNLRMPNIKAGQDYAYWLHILKTGKRAHLFPEVLMSCRIHKDSLSRNKFIKAKQQWKIYREIEKIPIVRAFPYFVLYTSQALTH